MVVDPHVRVNGALRRGLPYALDTVPPAQRRGAKTKKGPRNAGPNPSELYPEQKHGVRRWDVQ